MSLKTMKFPKASVNKSTSLSFSEMTKWGKGSGDSGGDRKMDTITLFNDLKGCQVKEGADFWCWALRKTEWEAMCGKVAGGQLSALYKENLPGQGCTHTRASTESNRLGQIQAAPLISSSHGAVFLSYLSPQLSIRTAIPTFRGRPRIERKHTYLTLNM